MIIYELAGVILVLGGEAMNVPVLYVFSCAVQKLTHSPIGGGTISLKDGNCTAAFTSLPRLPLLCK